MIGLNECMSDLRPMLAGAAGEFTSLIRAIEGGHPDHLGNPTPCAEYDVRALLNHLLYWGPWLDAALRRRPAPEVTGGERDVDLMRGRWADELCGLVDDLVGSCAGPGALEGTTKFGGTEMPARAIAQMVLTEWVVHGWDLARATGRSMRVDPATAQELYEASLATAEQARRMKVFGPEVSCPAEAPALERLLAVTGRDPGWRVRLW